ncbi:hypothetical protein D1007_53200 [Hordeum vulgare]|nr:hypothetical protein D1007_53200 [Hordeum vulgare]
MVARDSEGKGGGVVVFWRRGLSVELRDFSRFHMDLEIKEEDGFKWRFTEIYGVPRAEKKHVTWKVMRILHNQASLPWVCAGDFNEVLFADEKEGGNEKTQACMGRFGEALEGGQGVIEGLKEVAGKLKDLSRNVLGGLEKRLKKARKEVERWRWMPVSKKKVAGEEVARYRLEKLEKMERLEEQLNTFYK